MTENDYLHSFSQRPLLSLNERIGDSASCIQEIKTKSIKYLINGNKY